MYSVLDSIHGSQGMLAVHLLYSHYILVLHSILLLAYMLLNLTIAIAIAVALSVVGEHVNAIFVNFVLCLLSGLFIRPVEKGVEE